MASRYPTFKRHEYNCINDPHAAAVLVNKIKTAEARLRRWENSVGVARENLGPTEKTYRAYEVLLETLRKCGLDEPIPSDEYRKYKLSELLPLLMKNSQFSAVGNRLELVLRIAMLYAKVDTASCLADMLDVAAPTEEVAENSREYQRCEREVERAKGDLEALWLEAPAMFSEVPLIWSDDPPADIPEEARAKRREANVKRILLSFAKVWRERAPLYTRPSTTEAYKTEIHPTTIDGIAIESLPRERREKWLSAFNELKLGELPPRSMFTPILYAKSPKEVEAEQQQATSPRKGIFSLVGPSS